MQKYNTISKASERAILIDTKDDENKNDFMVHTAEHTADHTEQQEEEKYNVENKKYHNEPSTGNDQHATDIVIKINDMSITSEYIAPKSDDYIECTDITKCKAMKRIIYLMEYYNQINQAKTMDAFVMICDFIENLKNYSISKFMEDWHQCKTNHFKNQRD
eukprot:160800_1